MVCVDVCYGIKTLQYRRRTEDGNEVEGGRAGMGLHPTHNGAAPHTPSLQILNSAPLFLGVSF